MIRLTADLPGSGGELRADPEDFVVRESIPYAPEGSGAHAFLRIEKRGVDTLEAARRILRVLEDQSSPRLPPEMGMAGLKDRHAVAEQWISLPWAADRELPPAGSLAEGVELLEATRHRHKLRKGHVAANRFEITIRAVPEGGFERARATLEALQERGVPYRFGPQRFGRDGDNAEQARAILSGRARAPRDRRLASLLMSALQSEVFNRVLDLRLERGLFERAIEGDRMTKHATGGQFWVDDPDAETARVRALEISPLARLPGRKLAPLRGLAAELEAEALSASGLDEPTLGRLGVGVFRALRHPLPHASIEALGPDSFRVELELPSGAYATVVLDELLKPADGPLRRVLEPRS